MGLFYNYNKPGRGISEEEAKERNYFKILGRKITLIIKANLLFFGVNIILFAALSYFVMPFFIITDKDASNMLIEHLMNIVQSKQIMSPVPFIILALFSPTFSGLTYLCRNFSRQEHVFLISDFFEQTKKNFKQSITAGLIMSFSLYVYITAFIYYRNFGSIVFQAIILMIGILLTFASFYVFPLIVTYRLSLASIFKNALIFSIVNMPYNALLLFALTAIHLLLIINMPVIWLILNVFFLIAFSVYTINYVTWSALSKYMNGSN